MNASISVSHWLQASHSVPEKLGVRRMDAKLMIVQGQNGCIVTIDPGGNGSRSDKLPELMSAGP